MRRETFVIAVARAAVVAIPAMARKIVNFGTGAPRAKKEPVTSLADVKGMKIAAGDRFWAAVLKRLGAAPISIRLPEMHPGLNRGTVEGVNMVGTAFMPCMPFEATRRHDDLPLGVCFNCSA